MKPRITYSQFQALQGFTEQELQAMSFDQLQVLAEQNRRDDELELLTKGATRTAPGNRVPMRDAIARAIAAVVHTATKDFDARLKALEQK